MQNPKFQRTLDKAFCNLCRQPVELRTFEQAAQLLKINFSGVKLLAENFQIHRLNDSRGTIKICGESLMKILYARPTMEFDADIFKTNPSDAEVVFS